MAEEIVACPGCGKKFRIPEGAPGGTFQCTACNASVPYGTAAQKGGAPKAGARGATGAAAGRSAPASSKAAAKAAHSRAKAARRHEAEDEPDERGARRGAPKKDKDQQLVLWLGLGGVAVVAVGAFFLMSKQKPKHYEPAVAPPPPAVAPVTPPPEPTPAPEAQPAGGAAGTQPGAGEPKPAAASGIGEARQATGTGSGWSSDPNVLFVRYDDAPGVTPQERETLDKDVVLFCDRDSGKAGVDARNRLKKQARKAVPPLLSVFEKHWKGKKWEDDAEKFASYQVQQLLMEITKADRPRDFLARFDPRVAVPAKDFETAAKMWTNWWNTKGKDIEKYKDFAE
jgi:hypothetical protein